jgi:hypothetical protein
MSTMVRFAGSIATLSLGLAALPATATAEAGSAAPGRVQVIQAVPDEVLDVAVDGKTVESGSEEGAVLGPFAMSPGSHQVEFTGASGSDSLVSTVHVASGSSSDVVVHLPAQVGGAPVVNSYRTPTSPIGPGKARVLIAHTATVAPADVRVDGKVVFHDIANGEYATADLPAGSHTVSLLPAGLTGPAILGPLKMSLKAGTATMVYAVGNPRTHSMNVIVHDATLSSNGAGVPASIDTGSSGLAAGVRVRPFSVRRAFSAAHGTTSASRPSEDHTSWWAALTVAVLLGAGGPVLLAKRRRR